MDLIPLICPSWARISKNKNKIYKYRIGQGEIIIAIEFRYRVFGKNCVFSTTHLPTYRCKLQSNIFWKNTQNLLNTLKACLPTFGRMTLRAIPMQFTSSSFMSNSNKFKQIKGYSKKIKELDYYCTLTNFLFHNCYF